MSNFKNISTRIFGFPSTGVILFLFCSFFLLSIEPVSSQVINNNGAAISVTSGTLVNSQDAVNTAGILSNSGTITLSRDFTNTATTNGNGTYLIGRNWTDGGVFIPGTSSVIFNGSANQSVANPAGETFFNLSLINSGASGSNLLGLSNNVTVQGTLSLSTGNINTGTSKLLLSNPIPSALNYISVTGSRVLGKFERGVNQAGTYLFPLGTTAHYNPANLITNSVNTAGTILSEFLTPPSIDSTGLPLPDPPDEVARVYQDGYWKMTSNGFSSGNFNLNLNATGFTSFLIHDITRIIKRTTGGSWVIDGTHSPASGSIVFRNNLTGDISSSGTEFALGQSRPRIIKQPGDTAVCESKPYAPSNAEFELFATSTRTLTYTWYKEPSVLLTGPHYNTTGHNTLIIIDVALSDSGKYYCIVTDDYGTSTRSVSAKLTVNKRPVVTMTNSAQNNTCSNVSFSNIVLGESNGVVGTSFAWYRTNPSGIVTAVPLTGSIPAVGGFISGSFTNTTNAPIKITFYITPIGPNPTACAGHIDSAYIKVNPIPKIVPVNVKPQICYGGTTDVQLTTPTTLTMGAVTFDYTVSVTDGTVVGPTAPGFNLTNGQHLKFSYQNNSDTIKSVIYTVVPRAIALGCPDGVTQAPEVKIHAKPIQSITIIKQLTCDGGSDATLRANLSKGASPYTILWRGPFGYTNNIATIINLKAGPYQATVTDNLGCSNQLSENVFGASVVSLVLVSSNVSCPGYSDGGLQVKVDGSTTGLPPFEYWIVRNSIDTVVHSTLNAVEVYNFHNGLPEGDYTVHMRDVQGCYEKQPPTIHISQPDPMIVSFSKSSFPGGFNISCKGYNDGAAWVNTITGGNGGYTYHWYTLNGNIPGATNTNRIDNVTAGKYYLEVRDSKNCYMIDSVVLTEPAGIVLTGSQVSVSRDGNYNISCNGGNDGYIRLTLAGGSGSFIFNWTDSLGTYSASTKDISNLRAGVYTATITDISNSTCLLMPKPRFKLTEPTSLTVTAVKSISADGSKNINCYGGTGSVNLTVTGGSTGTYKFNWTTSNGSGIVNGQEDQNTLTAGDYHVVVTDSNLCVTTADITLTQPAKLGLTLQPTDLTCVDQGSINLTVSGGIGPFTYSWSNGAITQNISNLTAGFYSVTVTDFNGCTKTDSARVNLPPPVTFTSTVSDHNGFNIGCQGLSDGWIKINTTSGLAPFVFDWTEPDLTHSSSKDLSGLKTGQYTLLITDKNSCTATGSFDLTEPGKLSMNLALSISVDGIHNISCAGASTGSISVTPLNNAGGVNYLWSDGHIEKDRINIPAGDYRVIILDQNNCNADTNVTLTEPDSIKIAFDITQAFCPDSPDGEIRISVTGGIPGSGYTYRWSDNSTGSVVSNILRGWWWVIATDANNCAVKDSIEMKPQRETCLIIPNIFSPNGDNINDVWNIGMIDLYPNMEIKIFNRWGELVWKSARGYPDPWDGRSNGTLLPIDSYHYLIDLHNGSKPIIGNITIVK